jgi:hypothetical protein
MEKKISVERLFSLGDFKNIKFYDEITEIPEEVANNPEASSLLRYLQLLEIEYSYNHYMLLVEKLYGHKLPLDEILELLEKERSLVFENLLKVINHKNEKNLELPVTNTVDIKSGE